MERRTFFRNSAGIAAAAVGLAVAPVAANAVSAEAGTENETDPFGVSATELWEALKSLL